MSSPARKIYLFNLLSTQALMHNVSFMLSSHFYFSIEPVKQLIQRKIAIIFLFISLSQRDDSFDHPKHMFKLMGKK